MEILVKEKFNLLKKTYGTLVWDSDASKIGKVCCDCSGLISSYTGIFRNSSGFKTAAKQIYPIKTIGEAPIGALVWKDGHIGVYTGMEGGAAYYIAADGSAYGCRKNKLPSNFTHWFLSTDIAYVETSDNVAGAISIGNFVTIKKGSVYGGLADTRGKPVSEPIIGRELTVGMLDTNNGVPEAKLIEISSWVAVSSLINVKRQI